MTRAIAPVAIDADTPRRDSYLQLMWRRFNGRATARVGLILLVLLIAVAVFAPLLAPYPADAVSVQEILQPPGAGHWFGTDELGRDILSRAVYGAQVSLLVVGSALLVALIIGSLIGVIAGFAGGVLDSVLMRIADAMLAFPVLVLALAIVAALGPSVTNAAIAIAAVNVPGFARLSRGEVLALRRSEFVDAARAAGSSTASIIVTHISRSIGGTLLVYASLRASVGIITESSLAFLGLGASPPTATWGGMVATGSRYLGEAWWASFFPGLAILIAVLALNFTGDGLNDALNIRLDATSGRSARRRRLRATRSRDTGDDAKAPTNLIPTT